MISIATEIRYHIMYISHKKVKRFQFSIIWMHSNMIEKPFWLFIYLFRSIRFRCVSAFECVCSYNGYTWCGSTKCLRKYPIKPIVSYALIMFIITKWLHTHLICSVYEFNTYTKTIASNDWRLRVSKFETFSKHKKFGANGLYLCKIFWNIYRSMSIWDQTFGFYRLLSLWHMVWLILNCIFFSDLVTFTKDVYFIIVNFSHNIFCCCFWLQNLGNTFPCVFLWT